MIHSRATQKCTHLTRAAHQPDLSRHTECAAVSSACGPLPGDLGTTWHAQASLRSVKGPPAAACTRTAAAAPAPRHAKSMLSSSPRTCPIELLVLAADSASLSSSGTGHRGRAACGICARWRTHAREPARSTRAALKAETRCACGRGGVEAGWPISRPPSVDAGRAGVETRRYCIDKASAYCNHSR